MENLSFGLDKVNDLLDRLSFLDKPHAPIEYLVPSKSQYYHQFLYNEGQELAYHYDHIYVIKPHLYPVGVHHRNPVVVHGHAPMTCLTPYFCHLYGYRPTGAENPKFIELFYLQWPTLRESNNHG